MKVKTLWVMTPAKDTPRRVVATEPGVEPSVEMETGPLGVTINAQILVPWSNIQEAELIQEKPAKRKPGRPRKVVDESAKPQKKTRARRASTKRTSPATD